MLEFNKVTKKFNYNSNIFNNLYGMAENIFAITSTRNNFKYLNINYESLKSGNIRFDNPRVNNLQSNDLEEFLRIFNSQQNRVFNKITFKNFVNNFFNYYVG